MEEMFKEIVADKADRSKFKGTMTTWLAQKHTQHNKITQNKTSQTFNIILFF